MHDSNSTDSRKTPRDLIRRIIAVLNAEYRTAPTAAEQPPPHPKKNTPLWVHALLFIITFITTTLAGSDGSLSFNALTKNGFPFSATLMIILLSHEMGHYCAARRFGLSATLPFFIPVPHIISLIGTLGAVIKIKSPLRSRRALLYVGMSGPIAGFIVSLAAVIIGLSLSTIQPLPVMPPDSFVLHFGDSLLFRALTFAIHGSMPPGHDVMLSPIAWAGWIGFLVTSLNLMPIGQLDGGHIVHALIGKKQRYFGWIAFLSLAALCAIWFYWVVWVILILFFVRIGHPVIADSTPLSRSERTIGWVTMLILIATFIPIPVEPLENDSIFPLTCPGCKTPLEPSGIAIVNERILVINDVDRTMYQLEKKDDGFHALPLFPITGVGSLANSDFEAIAVYQNILYLADERTRRIFAHNFSHPIPLAHDIASYNRRHNIRFSNDANAGFEGIAVSQQGDIMYILNEREPCVVYRLRKDGTALQTLSHFIPEDKSGTPIPDASDLYLEGDFLYILARKQNKILKLNTNTEKCIDEFDFSDIAVRLYFSEKGYGFAEGLTMHHGKLFLLFDSNGRPLRNSKLGMHGTLVILKRPQDF